MGARSRLRLGLEMVLAFVITTAGASASPAPTELLEACMRPEVPDMLGQVGIDPRIRTREGLKPLDVARASGHLEVAVLLESAMRTGS